MRTVTELGEHKIIEAIWKHLDVPPNVTVPFGDDVSAIDWPYKQSDALAVIKTDMLVGKTDVPPRMSYWQAARKAIVMNVSDLAAKGAKPLGLLVSLVLPPNLSENDIGQIGKGLNAGAREYDSYILGGDTCETQDLIVSVAVLGVVKRQNLVLRSGAQQGDIVATTGPYGLASSGLKILKEGLSAPERINEKLVHSVLMPKARLKEGLALAKARATSASIDSSDGLAWSLYEISRASNVGITIDILPIAQEAVEFAEIHSLDPLELSLYGGEEYELVVTIKPKDWRKAGRAVEREGGTLTKIGETTKESKALFLKQGCKLIKIEARGYEHFKSDGNR